MSEQVDGLPERIARNIAVNPHTGCWEWTGSLNHDGYGKAGWQGKKTNAHRIVYELLVGAVSDEHDLDHLCRVRECVNPDHLEPVSHRENVLRGVSIVSHCATRTHCPQGHEYTPENTYHYPSETPRRRCVACRALRNARVRASRARNR